MKIDGYNIYVYCNNVEFMNYNESLYLSKDGINFIHMLRQSSPYVVTFKQEVYPAWDKKHAERNRGRYELYDSKIHIIDKHNSSYLNEFLKSEFYTEVLNED